MWVHNEMIQLSLIHDRCQVGRWKISVWKMSNTVFVVVNTIEETRKVEVYLLPNIRDHLKLEKSSVCVKDSLQRLPTIE